MITTKLKRKEGIGPVSPRQRALNAAFWRAAEAGDVKRVEKLLQSGADVNAKVSSIPPEFLRGVSAGAISFGKVFNSCLKSALQIAKENGNSEVVNLLKRKGAKA